ncbi:hypothetical protein SAMN05428642_1025 [Flaviramulus basaltis]|uniref:Uncharacterized protein n=1 Tax=Flaviramulus basaltis TaxID=369401 RepID=A0A1K2IFX8_9FLAO|nr:hypothetical protein [Flaviramulus basaltis]SFZ91333.1 hypothetical protein SAMN05428642_1025 [Flaviramulus basaltis]
MKKTTICNHCSSEYTPRRRGVQKFCSNSCRSRSWLLKQNKTKPNKITLEQHKIQVPTVQSVPKKEEKMSLGGVGNAAAGSALAQLGIRLITPTQNKPATKKDIQELKSILTGARYLPINNFQNDALGRKPFYDVDTGFVVFLNIS